MYGAGGAVTAALLPSAAGGELDRLAADFAEALAALPRVKVGASSRAVAAVHHGLLDLADGAKLGPAQRAAAASLTARVTTARSDVARLAGHGDSADAVAAAAARMVGAADDPVAAGTLAAVRAVTAIEADRADRAAAHVDEGLAVCPSGPRVVSLTALRAHVLGLSGAAPRDVEAAAEAAVDAAADLRPDERGTVVGLSFDTYHPIRAADRAHSALLAAGLIAESEPYAALILPGFDAMGLPGFASHARFERALALVRVNGAAGVEESCALVAEAVGISADRRTGALLDLAGGWLAAVRPFWKGAEVAETAQAVRLWRAG
jgi:hypothetical protein